jgi:predicted permease
MHDLRYAFRLLARNPLFALTAIVWLAIGIGANTTIFTIANALLFRAPAGVVDAERLVDIGRSQEGRGFDNSSYPNYLDVRLRNRSFASMYAYRFDPQAMSLGTDAGAESVYGGVVTNNYFDALGTRPAAGRLLSARDSEQPGANPVVVLGHRLWSRRFHEDKTIVGRQLKINGFAFTVIGVAEEGFQGTTLFAPDLWIPMAMVGEAMPRKSGSLLTERDGVWLMMGGRLKPGVSAAQAQAELTSIAATLEREYPEENRGKGLRAVPLSPIPGNGAPVAAFLGGLMAVVGLVLLIACANVTGVLLARATARRREIAVRLALGAGRGRLVRQMLVETMLLFAAGGAAGLLLARVMTTVLVSLLPALPVQIGVSLALDLRAVLFTLGLSLVAAVLSGLVPAFHASKGDVVGSLKADAHGSRERMRLRNAFVVAQVALSLVLVVGAGLFARALRRASTIDPGFSTAGVEVATLDLALGGATDATGPAFARELIHRVRATPGVENATLSAVLPLGMSGMGLGPLSTPGMTDDPLDADWNVVEPRYFATLRMPLLRGRDFTDADGPHTPLVAIVNQTLAGHLWPNRDAIGQTLVQQTGRPGTPDATRTLTVIGVARDAKYRSLGDRARNFIYVPLQQQYLPRTNIVARSTNGQKLAGELRAIVRSMNPNLPIVRLQTLDEFTSIGLIPQRVAASVAGTLGMVGLLLAALGIYGVTAYLVTTRTREIGIRMALGAETAGVMRLVLRQGMNLVLLGIVIGSLLAAAGGRVVASLLFGVGSLDPVAFLGAAAVFCAIGLMACYFPARRATRIDPTVALRCE